MNERMKVISIMWGLLLASLFIVLTVFGKKYLKKIQPYELLENRLASIAMKYVDEELDLEKGNSIIKVNDLIEANYLTDFMVDGDKCDGYVIVKYGNTKEYEPYIKCGKYTTKGYND